MGKQKEGKKEFCYHNHFHENDHIKSKLILGSEHNAQNPLVSVIMPVYNHPDFLKKSLLSVINQRCDFDYEIIIVDNGHPDYQSKNQEIIENLHCDKIRYYVNEENIGGVGSENRGVQLSKGMYISFCHDDDMLCEDALQTLINSVKEIDSTSSAVFGHYVPMDEDDIILTHRSEWDSIFLRKKNKYNVSLYDFLLNNYTNGCGSLYKRTCYIEIGGFCKDYIPCPDYALNIFYTKMFGSYAIKKTTMRYRVSTQGDSSKVYNDVIKANRNIKELLLLSELKANFLFKMIINTGMRSEEYHQLSRWSPTKPSKIKYLIYRIINRTIINIMYISRSFR